MKHIGLQVGSGLIELDYEVGGAGKVSSNLAIKEGDEDWHSDYTGFWNASVEMLERLVMCQAIAGVDVTAPNYLESLEAALEGLENAI